MKKSQENDEEQKWDKLLQIHTTGRDDSNSDQYRYPYEPTPYTVLERLANSGLLCKENTLLDYGCGKGRVDFFLSYQTRCHTIGVEYNERIYEKAIENREQGAAAGRTEFVLADAVQFSVPAEVDRIYLNFSDPWPKDRHARRRLTSPPFMAVYDQILQKDGRVEFKTDNQDLFSYSLEAIPEAGWRITEYTRDLHHSEMAEGNVMTEYEEKFSSEGSRIYRVEARRRLPEFLRK